MSEHNEWIAVTLAVLAIFGTIAGIVLYERQLSAERGMIDLEARAISTWSTKEITVKRGQRVRIRISNRDTVTHGFAIPELDIDERVIPAGHIEIVEFTPKYEGTYTYKCIVQCDRKMHDFMTGKLIVIK